MVGELAVEYAGLDALELKAGPERANVGLVRRGPQATRELQVSGPSSHGEAGGRAETARYDQSGMDAGQVSGEIAIIQ